MDEITERFICGDALAELRKLPEESVDTCMTSPPYYGLRDYGNEQIFGGDKDCEHTWGINPVEHDALRYRGHNANVGSNKNPEIHPGKEKSGGQDCIYCGAWKGQLGLEPTPEMYIEHLTEIFNEVKRVLKKEGTFWLNLGDTYGGSGCGRHDYREKGSISPMALFSEKDNPQQKIMPKCLLMIPERVALAMIQGIEKPFIKDRALRGWLAGLIDGEGSVIIRKVNQGKKYQDSYGIVLDVKMTNREAVERCKEITGFGCVNEWSDKRNPNYRQMYLWRVYGGSAVKILRDIFPFLIVKRKQAQIAHTLQENIKKYAMGRHKKVPPEDIEYRKNLKALMSQINQHPETELPPYIIKEIPFNRIGGGWILRNKIIWYKPNAMPSSVKDRFSNRWEYIFMFSKSQRYYFDLDAVREAHAYPETFGTRPDKGKCGDKLYGMQPGDRTGNPLGKNPGDVIKVGVETRTMGALIGAGGGVKVPGGKGWTGHPPGGGHRIKHDPRWCPPEGKRPIDFWEISTQPFPEAHFAVFPEKLCEKPIKAGCPKEVCKKCGKARERMVEKEVDPLWKPKYESRYKDSHGTEEGGNPRSRHKNTAIEQALHTSTKTIGWTSCGCNAGFEGGIVLDPFAGAGTVGVVAKSMGRRFILIDIKEEYIKMAKRRVAQIGHQKELFE